MIFHEYAIATEENIARCVTNMLALCFHMCKVSHSFSCLNMKGSVSKATYNNFIILLFQLTSTSFWASFSNY